MAAPLPASIAAPAGLLAQLTTGTQTVGVAILLLAVLLAAAWLRPTRFLHFALSLLTHSVYKLRVLGREHVPVRGGALLVCNHVSAVDWLLLLAAAPRRVRFLVFGPLPRSGLLRRLWRWAGIIAVDEARPRGIARGLRRAAEALARGELVGLFAEGQATLTGFMLPFHRAYDQLVKRSPAPVIPVRMDQLWGSVFSYHGGRYFWKWPLRLPYPVTVAFGKPLPPQTPGAEVRQAIQELSADCAVARVPDRLPVHRRFLRLACRRPFRTCVIDGAANDLRLSYGRTLAGGICLSRLLRPMLSGEPMVGVWLPQGAGGVLANLSLALLGKASVNLNYTAGADAVRSALRQSGCRHVVTARRFVNRFPLDPGPGVELIYLEDLAARVSPRQKLVAFLGVLLLPALLLERLLGLHRHTPDDLATVIFSSGSTGDPKGVMLTHANVAANADSIIQGASVNGRDRLLGILPFFHSFGYTVTLWAPLQVGAAAVYYPDPRAAKEIGELCRRHRCTVYLSTATFLRFCLRKAEPGDFDSVRLLVCGAEKLPVALARDFEKKFGVLPLEGYGCTELSPAVAFNVPDVVQGDFRQIGNKPGSIGQPLPGIACKVVHPETYQPLPTGEDGLLLVRGANVMRGYLGRPDLTAEAIRDGWYVTGDIGHIDADGFVTLTGRLSRFAKIGGEMVPLERIQDELHEVLGTSERVCGVTCVPDESRGERVVVLYVQAQLPTLGVEVRAWQRHLCGRGLPSLWVPAADQFYPVAELPTLGSGKLDLRRLKELAMELAAGKS